MTNREYRTALMQVHRCIECRARDAHTIAGFTLCYACALKSGKRALAYYYRNREKVRKQQNEYRSRKREEADR